MDPGAGRDRRPHALFALIAPLLLTACSAEKRPAGPTQPQSQPNGPDDPRIAVVENNAFQIGQGGRYFAWYGCAACHDGNASGVRDLADGRWKNGGSFDRVYRSIATGHTANAATLGDRIPPEQLWQLTAYVRSLKDLPPGKRRRQDFDQVGEPQGSNWSGPVQ